MSTLNPGSLILLLALAHPRPYLTPGALCSPADPDFDGWRYPGKMAHCVRNVHPATRRAVYAAYGIPPEQQGQYELDHRVPLCAGGSNSAYNLWPQPWQEAAAKDRLEDQICAQLRDGRLSPRAAQLAFVRRLP